MTPPKPTSALPDGASIEAVVAERIAALLALTGSEVTDLRQVVIEQAERGLIRATWAFTDGHVVRAAKLLGMDRNTYSRKARAYGLMAKVSRGRKPRAESNGRPPVG